MLDVRQTLQQVHDNAPAHLRERIARLIVAVEVTEPDGVSSRNDEEDKQPDDVLSVLRDNSDTLLALLRTLEPDAPLKKAIRDFEHIAVKVKEAVTTVSKELTELLKADKEDLKGISASDLAKLSSLLLSHASEMDKTLEIAKTMKTLAGKTEKEKKTKPIEHKQQKKIRLGPEEKDEDDKKDKKPEKEPEEEKAMSLKELNDLLGKPK